MAKSPIAAARVAKGLTQKDLADKLGVSSQLVWEWENTNKPIKPVYLYAICHVTGFSPDDILLPGELN